jgi:hypothetical protein
MLPLSQDLHKKEGDCIANMQLEDLMIVQDLPPSPELNKPAYKKIQSDRQLLVAFGSLCVITLMVALDATSLAVALPVSIITQKTMLLLLVLLTKS